MSILPREYRRVLKVAIALHKLGDMSLASRPGAPSSVLRYWQEQEDARRRSELAKTGVATDTDRSPEWAPFWGEAARMVAAFDALKEFEDGDDEPAA